MQNKIRNMDILTQIGQGAEWHLNLTKNIFKKVCVLSSPYSNIITSMLWLTYKYWTLLKTSLIDPERFIWLVIQWMAPPLQMFKWALAQIKNTD